MAIVALGQAFFSPNPSVFPCQYYNTAARYSFIIWGMNNGLLLAHFLRHSVTPLKQQEEKNQYQVRMP
jgi:hypothetical protein